MLPITASPTSVVRPWRLSRRESSCQDEIRFGDSVFSSLYLMTRSNTKDVETSLGQPPGLLFTIQPNHFDFRSQSTSTFQSTHSTTFSIRTQVTLFCPVTPAHFTSIRTYNRDDIEHGSQCLVDTSTGLAAGGEQQRLHLCQPVRCC